MSTPFCPVCQRWDGSHSTGCPQTGQPYPGYDRFRWFREGAERAAAAAPTSEWVRRARSSTLPAKEFSLS